VEFRDGGVQARLDRADRDFQDFSDLTVFQVLEVGQNQGLPQRIGEPGDAGADPVAAFLALQLGQGAGRLADQQVDQGAGVGVPPFGPLIQADRRLPSGLAERVDGLMGGDRVQPGADRPAVFVETSLQVDLQERVLEDVLGQRRVAV
jgi:hypothetical protein